MHFSPFRHGEHFHFHFQGKYIHSQLIDIHTGEPLKNNLSTTT